jgi:hypothetical protein
VRPRTKSSVLWGAVGGVAFAALVQGYQLVAGPLDVGPAVIVGVAVVVAAVVAGVTYLTEVRLTTKGRT